MQARIQDLVVPLAVVAVVGMMVFPLPVTVLDLLLMCNISFSLALLISCVYLAQPERFTSLPTLLLLTTLFRLGLNISTTRQLLGQGTAPPVVVTFGEFVVGGSLVVGTVIFIIVTIVQFLVIAKGAERVAEVAARFTLDAMPGKQMAIDADVRSGVIGLAEARERRLDLQRESRLFGALDGAMKFVKGDAIAGVLITILNIVAGLIVGVTLHRLGLQEAAARYTIFTIGDGLVSQIPALFVAVSAAIAVTRVSDKENSFIGREVMRQLAREPQALGTTAVLLVLLAFVPGFSALSFLLLGSVFAVAAYRAGGSQRDRDEPRFQPKIFSALVLRLSPQATVLLQQEAALPQLLQHFRQRVFDRHGILLPDLQFDIDPSLADVRAQLFFHGAAARAILRSGGSSFSDEALRSIEEFVEQHLPELVDDTQTRMLLEAYDGICGDLINSLVPAVLNVTTLTRVLRALVAEGVSLREFHNILQCAADFAALHGCQKLECGADSEGRVRWLELLAAVRRGLRRSLRALTGDRAVLDVLMLSDQVDTLLARAAQSAVAIEPDIQQRIIERTQQLGRGMERLIVVASSSARALLGQLLRAGGVKALVLCADETESGFNVRGEVDLPRAEVVELRRPAVKLAA